MIQKVQSLFGEGALPFWQAVTILGDGFFVFLAFAVLAWIWSTTCAVRVGLVSVVIGILVGFLKVAIREPRPYLTDSTIIPWQAGSGFGMPSGHSASAVGLFVLLWLLRRSAWTLGITLAAILLVGVSRLYLGVHTAEQVMAGWLLGLLVVVVAQRFGDAIGDTLSRLDLRIHIVFAMLCCVALAFGQHALSVRLLENFVVPSEWLERAEAARALAGTPSKGEIDRVIAADFFELHRIYLPALLLGMWLTAIAARAGYSMGRLDLAAKILNLSIGLPVLLAAIVSIVLARETSWLALTLIVATPLAVAIGVPWLSKKVASVVPRRSHHPEP